MNSINITISMRKRLNHDIFWEPTYFLKPIPDGDSVVRVRALSPSVKTLEHVKKADGLQDLGCCEKLMG